MKKFLAILPLVAIAATSSANLVVNGDFETDAYVNPYSTVTTVTGWTVIGRNVAGIKTPYLGAPNQEIDLSGVVDTTPGTSGLEQTLTTVVGQKYTLMFDVYAGERFTTYAGGVDYSLNGVSVASNLQGNRTTMSYTFFGTGADTISFISNRGNVSHIDNVDVAAAVPAPAAMASFAIGALRLRRRRK